MDIVQEDNGKKGVFYAVEDGSYIGEMTYVWVDKDRIIIDHTGVPDRYRNKGIAKFLLDEAVRFARDKKLKIIPVCPFVAVQFQRMPEFNDVH